MILSLSGHGPDAETFEKASHGSDDPVFLSQNDLAFMFETTFILRLTEWASAAEKDEVCLSICQHFIDPVLNLDCPYTYFHVFTHLSAVAFSETMFILPASCPRVET
jgi:hypothetical protein